MADLSEFGLSPEAIAALEALGKHPERLRGLELVADRAGEVADVVTRQLLARRHSSKAEGAVREGDGDIVAARFSGRYKSVMSAMRAHQMSVEALKVAQERYDGTLAGLEYARGKYEEFLDEHPELRGLKE